MPLKSSLHYQELDFELAGQLGLVVLKSDRETLHNVENSSW